MPRANRRIVGGSSDSRLLAYRGKTRMLSPWSPALALHQGPLRTLTQSRRRLRFSLPEGLHIYLPFTSRGLLLASTPPTLLHHSKRHLHPHKWVCYRSPLPSPHHAVSRAHSLWTRAKRLMVPKIMGRKSMKLKLGRDQNRQLRWTPMDDDNPRDPLFHGFD